MKRILILDGMRSGTGLRDGVNGGYISLENLGISEKTKAAIENWQSRYTKMQSYEYENLIEVENLDIEGLEIAKALKIEMPNNDIRYFSDAKMTTKYVE